MTSTMTPRPVRSARTRRLRWAVPSALAAAAVGAAVLVPVVASAAPALPARTSGELLASVSAAGQTSLSGTVVETAHLGLPALPDTGGSISLTSLLAGSRQAHVWTSGPDKVRIALVGSLAETDLIRNGTDAWLWTSGKNTAQHLALQPGKAAPAAAVGAESMTPQAAAKQALAAVEPTTSVTVDGTASVAGRSAYELVLRPKDGRTLVGQIRLALDSETSVPLRVQVYARGGASPAFETSFTQVSFGEPDAAMFRFTPPRGATVSELGGTDAKAVEPRTDIAAANKAGAPAAPKVTGTGWTSVVEVDGIDLTALPAPKEGSDPAAQLGALLKGMTPVHGTYGNGRVLRTALVSALLLDDGRMFIGAVRPDVLEEAAAR